MTIQFTNDYTHFIGTSRTILKEHGISVIMGSDFRQYAEIIKKERPMQALGVPFDPEHAVLRPRDSFWLIGRNEEGELIHSQACRIVETNGMSLAQYMLHGFRGFPPPLPNIDFKRSRFRATPGAHRIMGKVVYHGEVWMAPEKGTYRGVGLSTVLARTGLLEAYGRWDPDWLFGFMAQPVAFKGFSERMGYMHNEPGALRWFLEGKDNPLEGFLSYLSREDLEYLLDVPVSELVAKAS